MARSSATTSHIGSFDAEKNPTLARVVRETAGLNYEEPRHYWSVCLEPGSMRSDLPIFTTAPGAVQLDTDSARPAVTRRAVADAPGAFILQDVLSGNECDRLIKMVETMGFTEDAPVSLGRHIRKNENCVWLADDTLNDGIFERCRAMLPQEVEEGQVCGLNARWRLYKYNPSDIFRPHTDGSWPGSGVDSSGRQIIRDRYGDRWSQLTFVVFLNDEFDGGSTRFFYPIDPEGSQEHRVAEGQTPRGGVLCFFHGEHPQSPLHEGALVESGTKYIIRTDVLYMLPAR